MMSLKSSIFTAEKLVRAVNEPALTVTPLATPTIGWAVELIALTLPAALLDSPFYQLVE